MLSGPHVFVSGSTTFDLRQVVVVADVSATVVRVFTSSGPQEGLEVNRAAFEAAYQASLDAA